MLLLLDKNIFLNSRIIMFSIRKLFVTFILILIINFTSSTSTTESSSPTLLAEEPIKDCPVSCSNNRAGTPRRPVCGTDGHTYASTCHLRRAQCQQPALELKHRGKCKIVDDKPCFTDRRNQLSKQPAAPVSMFTPACRSDGRYSPIQCFEVYCWCVNPHSGKPIPNTSVENNKPNCKRASRRRNGGGGRRSRPSGGSSGSKEGKGAGRKRNRACGRLDRTTFNKNMLDTFKMEYRRLPQSAISDGNTDLTMDGGTTDAELQRRVLEWKFASLDMNGDKLLEKNEYRGLRRLVRKVVVPRRCARTFTRTCDLDRDEVLSRDEWTACLGVDFNKHGCLADRQTVLDEQNSNLNLYIPECTADGRYKKTQCYVSTGYCFCVDEDSGKVIPGTSVKNLDPKCDSIMPALRPMKGCPEPKKQKFLKDLMEFLSKKMPMPSLSTNISESSQDDEEIHMPTISSESVANWHFRLFDRNKDKALERMEWKSFRVLVESQASLRHCGKKFPRYCDVNRDRKISFTEWLLCLGISEQQTQNSQRVFPMPSATTLNPSRTGKNPMEEILKPED